MNEYSLVYTPLHILEPTLRVDIAYSFAELLLIRLSCVGWAVYVVFGLKAAMNLWFRHIFLTTVAPVVYSYDNAELPLHYFHV